MTNVAAALRYAKRRGIAPELAVEQYELCLRSSREAKRRKRGVCERCGGETRYNGHGRVVSRLCRVCGPEEGRKKAANAIRGKGPQWLEVKKLLEERGSARFTEIRDEIGMTTGTAGSQIHYWYRAGWLVRIKRGMYVLGEVPA